MLTLQGETKASNSVLNLLGAHLLPGLLLIWVEGVGYIVKFYLVAF